METWRDYIFYEDEHLIVLNGDTRKVLPLMDANSVQLVPTSPPYYGLRDYGTAEWEGGSEDCDHKSPMAWASDSGDLGERGHVLNANEAKAIKRHGKDCLKCGATRIDSQIGSEQTPREFIEVMLAVFEDVKKVIHPSGSVVLNLGDSYAGSWGNYGGQNRGNGSQREISNGSVVKDQEARNGTFRPATASVEGFEEYVLRDDLTPEELSFVFYELSKASRTDLSTSEGLQ